MAGKGALKEPLPSEGAQQAVEGITMGLGKALKSGELTAEALPAQLHAELSELAGRDVSTDDVDVVARFVIGGEGRPKPREMRQAARRLGNELDRAWSGEAFATAQTEASDTIPTTHVAKGETANEAFNPRGRFPDLHQKGIKARFAISTSDGKFQEIGEVAGHGDNRDSNAHAELNWLKDHKDTLVSELQKNQDKPGLRIEAHVTSVCCAGCSKQLADFKVELSEKHGVDVPLLNYAYRMDTPGITGGDQIKKGQNHVWAIDHAAQQQSEGPKTFLGLSD